MLPETIRTDEAQTFLLPDGRSLSYMEWGDPDGFPAFYFHGTPSSRLEGVFAAGAAQRQGLRLIAVDRPGYGHSTFQPGRRFVDWPADVCALADGLGVDGFGVVGHSGAGPHLLACGALISPTRLRFIGALGPWGPLVTPEIIASLSPTDSFYAWAAQRGSWPFRAAFGPVGWCVKYAPGLFCRMLSASLPEVDREHMRDEVFLRHFRAIQREAFRQGGRGGAYELFLDYLPWGFEAADVAVPTHIWQGDRDNFIPREMGEYLARAIPDADLHWSAGKGHFAIEDLDQILAACAADLDPQQ